ncbi:MAG TPA: sigma-70 family RNA polymerase sigma factor [Gemmataceae bacterium]|nr:sigma-70 family RNA polymerase sigma factor [Gemmataceae bacterium]
MDARTLDRQSQQAEDADLARRTAAGDGDAFRLLTQRYYRSIGGFVLKRVLRPDLVEDLVQETFLEAYRSLKAGRLPDHFSSWLFGIAHNCCGKWLRRKRPVLFDPSAAPDVGSVPSEAELREEEEEQHKRLAELDRALAGLPEETRRLLEMKHKGDKTCEQIAAETGRPVGTIKSLLSRTYKLLRSVLRPV